MKSKHLRGGLFTLFLSFFTSTLLAAGPQHLHGHVPAVVARLTSLGTLPETNRLNLAISLPLRNQAALSNLLSQIYDPASPNYHHYLTPEQFTEQFGPTKSDYNAVIAFAKANGLRVTTTWPNRLLLDVSGTADQVERTLHLTINVYHHPTENRNFYAPSTEPSLDLSVPVLHISGLDNFELPHPRLAARRVTANQNASPNLGSGPGGGYMGTDFRAAYVPDSSRDGSGQTMGLFEFDGYSASDINDYESQAGLTNIPLQNVLIDGAGGGPQDPGGADVEVALDIEMAISMATNLSKVVVYIAPPDASFEDILNSMVQSNQIKQFSCSWYEPGGSAEPAADQIWEQMAAQGQSFFTASGDSCAYTGLIPFPGDSPYITQVGGTTLSTTGPGGVWSSEAVWNWGNGIGSSGGVSTQYPIPSWQTNISMTANQGSTTMRNTPDVAMTGDNVYVRADGEDYTVGGTSCAAPLWAGFAALVNQQAAASGKPSIGFVNPALYAIGSGPNYALDFHDISTGNNTWGGSPTKFYATAGYDLCTGWGTPAGQELINALANPEALVISPANGFVSTGGVGGPFTVTSDELSLTNAGTNALTWTLTNTSLWLNVSSSGGTLTPGGPASVVTVSLNNAASNLVVGTYIATLWFTNVNDESGQGVSYTLNVIAPPTITSQPTNQAVLEGMTVMFTVSATGGLPLSYQWQLNGTNLADGGNILGSQSTNLTVTDVSDADVGNYTVIVTNLAGVAVSSNATLSIIPSAPVITVQPTNQTAVVGQTVVFSVSAVGNMPLSYQWNFNGINIIGATNSVYLLSDVQLTNAGAYSVMIANGLGSTTSSNALLTVLPTPPCDPAPSDIVAWWPGEGNANDIIGTNNGTPVGNLTYTNGEVGQAFVFDGYTSYITVPASPSLNIGTGGGLTIECWVNPSVTNANSPGGAGGPLIEWDSQDTDGCEFWVEAQNSLYVNIKDTSGNPHTFRTAAGVVNSNIWQHVALTYDEGSGMATIYVNGVAAASSNFGSFAPQTTYPVNLGRRTGEVIGDGDTYAGMIDELSLYNRALSSNEIAAIYNAGSAGKCPPAPIPPVIVTQPTNETVAVGGTASFSVVASTTWALSYQWTFDGTDLTGATNATLTLTDVQLSQAGTYAVVVANVYGPTVSSNATLAVYGVPPFITTQPTNEAVAVDETASFSVVAGGTDPLSYQWSFDGTNLPGATNATLTLADVQFSQAGTYEVEITNPYGSTNSADAVLSVYGIPPFITTQPANQTVMVGGTASFSVTAGGSVPLSYQWQFDGISITGATNSVLSLTNAQPGEAGDYAVTVANPYGLTNSIPAILTVNLPGSCDPAPSDIVAWWPGEGNANDIIGTNNGTTVGKLTYTNGEVGQAFVFDGNTSYITVPASPSLNIGTGSGLTIECWVNPSVTNANSPGGAGGPLIEWDSQTTDGCEFWVEAQNSLYVNIKDTSGNPHTFRTAAGVVSTNTWQHVALTYDEGSGLMTMYVNGNVVGSANFGSFVPQTTYPVNIGRRTGQPIGDGDTYAGMIDELSLYNRALSSNEIAAIYNAGSAGKCPPASCDPAPSGIVSWWPGEGNANDIIGTNNGTPVGNLTYTNGEVGQAFVFDGCTSYITVPASPSLNIGSGGGLTIECWVNPSVTNAFSPGGAGGPLIEWDSQTTDGCEFWLEAQNSLYVNIKDTSGNPHTFRTAAGVVSTNTWQHVALTYDEGSGLMTMYVNGNVVGSANFGSFAPQTTYPVNIGRRTGQPIGDGDTYAGMIDELSLYNRALSSNEITAIYNAGSAGKCPSAPNPPVIVTQPTNQTVSVGGTASFSVVASSSSALNYQWTLDGTNLIGATNATLTLTDVQLSQAGTYQVAVTNPYGSTNSIPATLTVNLPPGAGIPVITAFNPSLGATGTVVNITGVNFSPAPSNNIVYFGAVQAVVSAASPTNLVVTVPVGATFAPITETVNGLTAYAQTPFLPTFPGNSTLGTNTFATSFNLGAGDGPIRLIAADVDGDGKPDLIVADDYGDDVLIYHNISTNGTLSAASFASPVELPVGPTVSGNDALLGLAVGDLTGDGHLDIAVANRYTSEISIFQNLSSPGVLTSNSFGTRIDIPVAGSPIAVAVMDMDGDGRPDLLTANYSSNSVSVLRNISTEGVLLSSNSFMPAISFATGSAPYTLAVGDLDGDGKPDVVTGAASSGSLTNAISVLRNISTVSNIVLQSHQDFAGLGQANSVAIGDLDGDGKPDVAICYGSGGQLSVYRNTSLPGAVTLAAPVNFALGGTGSTLTIGDMDGDGKPDLAAETQEPNQICLFRNISSPGSFTTNSLAPKITLALGDNPNGIALADLLGDGRPDLIFANTYGGTLTLAQNMTAFFGAGTPPAITAQPTNITVSAANAAVFSVVAGGTMPLSYQWIFNGTNVIAGATNSALVLTNVQFANEGLYSVTVTNLYGSVASSNALLIVTVDHFAWNTIPSPRFINSPFQVEIVAQDAANGVFTNYTGVVFIGSTNGIPVSPTVSSNFVQGVLTGTIVVSQTATNLVLSAADGSGHVGLANPINIADLPQMTSTSSGSTFYISWPTYPAGFVLETSTNLATGNWAPVTTPPFQLPGSGIYIEPITLSGTNTSAFYRLQFSGP